ncbi:MAG: DUF3990 domain-containing protein [Paludibacteraceae bacterium]|nr:DUF3990 domain-containing protein [Paludibacteraceae bacterium]
MRLYHGSNMFISEIDLSMGKKGKDFGRGFYLSALYPQALRMAELTVAKTNEGEPIVSEFIYDESKAQNLNVLCFDGYTKEWAEFIIMNRQNRSDLQVHNYDIVYGPIADDTVGATINLFVRQYIDIDELIRRLKFAEPKYQYFFATPSALTTLTKA